MPPYVIALFALITLLVLAPGAATVQAQMPLTPNTPQTGTITAQQPQIIYSFQANAGQTASITLTGTDPLRVQFGLFDASGVLLLAGVNPAQAATIDQIYRLPATGMYILQVTSANEQVGDFSVRLSLDGTSSSPPIQPPVGVGTSADCAALMQSVTDVLDDICAATGRNQVCYGNILVEAEPNPATADLSTFRFERLGDLLALADLRGMTLSPMDLTAGRWGVALMQVQANLPEALPGQNVTMLVFGAMQIADGSVLDNSASSRYGPMQSIYLRPGLGGTQCGETPDSGLLIQTPAGVGEIEMAINQIDVRIGSTVFIEPDISAQRLRFSTLEGQVAITSLGVTQIAQAGQTVGVPVDGLLLPAAAPEPPQPTNPNRVALLPVEGLLPSAEEPGSSGGTSGVIDPTRCTATITGSLRVNVRQGPGTVYDVIGGLDPGDTVPVTGRSSDGWYEVDYRGLMAWLARSVLELNGPCDDLPFAFIPPTPTPIPPTPTPTPTRPIAGDNEFRGVPIDLFGLLPVVLNGAISYPEGDQQDTVTYNLVNYSETEPADFRLSIQCTGEGAEYAEVVFADGSVRECYPQPYNFIQYNFRGAPRSGEFTIRFGDGVNGAYVQWRATFNYFFHEG